ncbi:hypothetical protein [Marinobacter similis]|uniref:Peptidoglycan-associated lipoprotein n=1 Tax=Marinobacter similis TaxID=1420916 RepID=W5YTW0_9GAMM|nr:hypothetical protein [Marinobacter similis]AHI29873.1 peptidoglycan-associated lipoprotein [Marinobacter similis]
MAYVTIDGNKYEKELIDLAVKHTTGQGEGKISVDEAKDLFKSAKDGQGVTDIEMATLKYIRGAYEFTDAGARTFDTEISRL